MPNIYFLDRDGLEYYHDNTSLMFLGKRYNIVFTGDYNVNQTTSARLVLQDELTVSSAQTGIEFPTVSCVATVTADDGYVAGTATVTRSGNTFTISVTEATKAFQFNVAFEIFGYPVDANNDPQPLMIFRQANITNQPTFYLSGTELNTGFDNADIAIYPDLSLIQSQIVPDTGVYVLADKEELLSSGQFVFTKGKITDNNLVSLKLGDSGKLYIGMEMPVINSIQLKSRSNTSDVRLTPYIDVFLKTPSGDISIKSISLEDDFTVSTNDSNSKVYTIEQNRFFDTIDLEKEIVQKMKEGRSLLYFQVAFHTN